MAELKRLKHVVDQAKRITDSNGTQLIYLLDEILQGTNSRERHVAVIRVMECLLGCKAIGAISTHDLELASAESLRDACQAVHFRETLHDRPGEPPMTFDYKLREGIATTSNALKLLEIVGLAERRSQRDGNLSPQNSPPIAGE
jgi:DNA mismatch repair ATPase MutS